MKKLSLALVIGFLLTSCATSNYYQMYQTKPITENITVEDDVVVFEDDNCKILYNFWEEGGDIGFVIYNKSNDNLYLHLDECFLVKNGYAYDYFQNRTYSTSRSTTVASSNAYSLQGVNSVSGPDYSFKNGYIAKTSNTVVGSSTNGISTVEQKIICVPPQTSKVISEFSIMSNIYHTCDLYLNPGKKDNKSVSFTEENTPLTFGNIIAYSLGDAKPIVRVNNYFYISKISNLNYTESIKMVNKEECGKKLPYTISVFKESGPDQFYNYYTVGEFKVH